MVRSPLPFLSMINLTSLALVAPTPLSRSDPLQMISNFFNAMDGHQTSLPWPSCPMKMSKTQIETAFDSDRWNAASHLIKICVGASHLLLEPEVVKLDSEHCIGVHTAYLSQWLLSTISYVQQVTPDVTSLTWLLSLFPPSAFIISRSIPTRKDAIRSSGQINGTGGAGGTVHPTHAPTAKI